MRFFAEDLNQRENAVRVLSGLPLLDLAKNIEPQVPAPLGYSEVAGIGPIGCGGQYSGHLNQAEEKSSELGQSEKALDILSGLLVGISGHAPPSPLPTSGAASP